MEGYLNVGRNRGCQKVVGMEGVRERADQCCCQYLGYLQCKCPGSFCLNSLSTPLCLFPPLPLQPLSPSHFNPPPPPPPISPCNLPSLALTSPPPSLPPLHLHRSLYPSPPIPFIFFLFHQILGQCSLHNFPLLTPTDAAHWCGVSLVMLCNGHHRHTVGHGRVVG